MLRRIAYFLIVTFILGGLGGGIAWYAFDFKPKFLAQVILDAAAAANRVGGGAAETRHWLSGVGTLTASDGIDITPQVGGIVEQVHFESGQDVQKGALLISLNTDTEEAELRSLTARLANAESDVRRREELFAKGFAPKADVDNFVPSATAWRPMPTASAPPSREIIIAPWTTGPAKNVSPGKYVAPGQPVVWLQSIDPIYADFTVTEADYGRIKPGLPVTARFNAGPGTEFKGEVTTTDARMSDASRMITVRATFANADRRLLPGMYADVLVDAGQPAGVVTVPQTAVTYSLYGDSVFVVVPAPADAAAKEASCHRRRCVKTGGAWRPGRSPGLQPLTGGTPDRTRSTRLQDDRQLIAQDRTARPFGKADPHFTDIFASARAYHGVRLILLAGLLAVNKLQIRSSRRYPTPDRDPDLLSAPAPTGSGLHHHAVQQAVA
jgi:RND family efflux transporter MFP subunit